MFHMMSCFNLRNNVTADELGKALSNFCDHMIEAGLLESVSPIGKRDSDTEMDTDEERAHQYFYIMSFINKKQCDNSYEYLDNPPEHANHVHLEIITKIKDNIHICWEDLPAI